MAHMNCASHIHKLRCRYSEAVRTSADLWGRRPEAMSSAGLWVVPGWRWRLCLFVETNLDQTDTDAAARPQYVAPADLWPVQSNWIELNYSMPMPYSLFQFSSFREVCKANSV